MAKKKEKIIEAEIPQVEETVIVEEPVIEKPVTKKESTVIERKVPKDEWEVKDRMYFLHGKNKPLSHLIKAANIYYFDEEKGYERELKYCENQKTCFVDEMKGDQRLAHVVFRNGVLNVPREKVVLQKLLSLYHPQRDKLFYEWKPKKVAEEEIDV